LNSSSNNRNEKVISSRQKFMVLLLVVEGSRFGQNWTEEFRQNVIGCESELGRRARLAAINMSSLERLVPGPAERLDGETGPARGLR
jgi:hypothetical protein